MRNPVILYSAVVLSMVLWSFSFIWTRVAIQTFSPMTLVSLRLTIAAALLFVYSKATSTFKPLRKGDLKLFLLLAFFEPFLYYVGETYGLTMVEPTLASVIISTIPLFAPLVAFFILRERISWNTIAGIVVSLFGVFLVVYQPHSAGLHGVWGILLMFLAVFSAIAYSATLRKIPSYYSAVDIIFYQSLLGLLYFIPSTLVFEYPEFVHQPLSFDSVFALLMLAVFASVLAFVLFARAVREVGVARINVFVNLIPVFTALFSWLLLGEQLTYTICLGIGLVVVGLFVSQIRKSVKF